MYGRYTFVELFVPNRLAYFQQLPATHTLPQRFGSGNYFKKWFSLYKNIA